jgi:hypothetical protein
VIDVIEKSRHVPLEDPLVVCPLTSAMFCPRLQTHAHADAPRSLALSRLEPIRYMPETGLEGRLQNVLDRALHHAITHSWDAEGRNFPGWRRFGISFRREGLG